MKKPTQRKAPPNKVQLENFLTPLNAKQERVFNSRKHVVMSGSAGVGKTILATYLGMRDIEARDYRRLIYIRSIVPSRDIGFLPGTEAEKIATYESPYQDIFFKLYNNTHAYDTLKNSGVVHFMPTSFLRGRNLSDAVIIVDEVQNMTFQELDTICTRMEDNVRFFFCGDYKQTDLKSGSGINKFFKILKGMDEFDFVEFTREDIVRSEFVKNYIITKEDLEDAQSGTK